MTGTLPTIATFWVGPRLRDFDHLCIQTWLEIGHPVKFFSYEPVANVPEGVELCDARRVLDRNVLVEKAPELADKPFTQANIFRLAMLMKGEGVWCDSDLALFRPLPPFKDILIGEEERGALVNAILWLPPDSEVMPTIIDAFLERKIPPWTYAKPRWKRLLRRATGGGASLDDYPKHQWGKHPLEYYVKKFKLQEQVKPYKTFYYPVIYDDYLFQSNPYQHILDDPEVCGLHVFYKRTEDLWAAPDDSFAAWLRETYGRALPRSQTAR